jgi:hypothetical protein
MTNSKWQQRNCHRCLHTGAYMHVRNVHMHICRYMLCRENHCASIHTYTHFTFAGEVIRWKHASSPPYFTCAHVHTYLHVHTCVYDYSWACGAYRAIFKASNREFLHVYIPKSHTFVYTNGRRENHGARHR